MTKCTFHKFGTSGEIEKHDAMCILPLNIGEPYFESHSEKSLFSFKATTRNSGLEVKPFLFSVNEKIYIFIWFWFLLLGFLTILILLYRILIVFSPRIRVSFYRSHIFRMFHCQLSDRSILTTYKYNPYSRSEYIFTSLDITFFSYREIRLSCLQSINQRMSVYKHTQIIEQILF